MEAELCEVQRTKSNNMTMVLYPCRYMPTLRPEPELYPIKGISGSTSPRLSSVIPRTLGQVQGSYTVNKFLSMDLKDKLRKKDFSLSI